MPRPCLASTPASRVVDCCPQSTLVEGGYTSRIHLERAARDTTSPSAGHCQATPPAGIAEYEGFDGDDFHIDFDRRQVTCP